MASAAPGDRESHVENSRRAGRSLFTRKAHGVGIGVGAVCGSKKREVGDGRKECLGGICYRRVRIVGNGVLLSMSLSVEVEIAHYQASQMTCRSREGVADCAFGPSRR